MKISLILNTEIIQRQHFAKHDLNFLTKKNVKVSSTLSLSGILLMKWFFVCLINNIESFNNTISGYKTTEFINKI